MTCRSRRGPSLVAFGRGDELGRRQDAAVGLDHAQQHLEMAATVVRRAQRDDGLAIRHEAAFVDGRAHAQAERITAVRSRDSSLSGRVTRKRPPPCSLAAAQAAPARDSNASKPACGDSHGTMPMLAVIASMLPFHAGAAPRCRRSV